MRALRALRALLAAATAAVAFGGAAASGQALLRLPLMSDLDVDTVGTYTYCVTTGVGDDAAAPARNVKIPITTAGLSTTVSAVTGGTVPFANLSVGDDLEIPGTGGAVSLRYVEAKASGDSITVGASAIDLSAVPDSFSWRKRACGSAAGSGWFSVAQFQNFSVSIQVDQGDATSVDVALECEVLGASSAPNPVWEANYLLANYGRASRTMKTIDNSVDFFDRCRVGFKLASDASDVGVAVEKISAYVRGR
jgi:hypothetical protein